MLNRTINPWHNSLPTPELVPQYRGVWNPVPYEIADIVTLGTGFYISTIPTSATDMPGVSAKWEPILDTSDYNELLQSLKTQQVAVSEQAQDTVTKLSTLDSQLRAVQSLSGIKSIGREPTTGDEPGLYRVNNTDIMWDGVQEVSRTAALAPEELITASVSSLDALRNYSGPAKSVIVTDPTQGGIFLRDTSVTSDDGGNHIVGVATWKRSGEVYNLHSYGGKAAYGNHDNSIALNKIIDSINENGIGGKAYSVVIYIPGAVGDYYFLSPTKPLVGHAVTVLGAGPEVTRCVADFAGAFFQLGTETAHMSSIVFENITLKHPYLVDEVYWRPTGGPNGGPRMGKTLNAGIAAAHPDKYEMASPDPTDMDKRVIFKAMNCSSWVLNNVKIDGCLRFAEFGGPGTYSSAFYMYGLRGWQYNRGLPAVTIYQGAGYTGEISSWFTQAENPMITELQINGKPHLFMEKMTTKPGNTMFKFVGHWDTWGVRGANALFERMWSLYSFNVPAGYACSFFEHQGVVCDYFAGDVIDFSGNKGSVSLLNLGNMRVSPVGGRFINLPYDSGYVELNAVHASSYMSGQSIIVVNNTNLIDVNLVGGRFHSSNFIEAAFEYTHPETLAPGYAVELTAPLSEGGTIKFPAGTAFSFGDNVKNFKLNAVDINKKPAAGSGTQQWFGAYGVVLGENTDNYNISNCTIDGQYIGLVNSKPNTIPSTRRRITGTYNKGALELGTENGFTTTVVPNSGQDWFNTTGYSMTVNVSGGTVESIKYIVYNGAPQSTMDTGRVDGSFIISPGEGLRLTYTEAPSFLARINV